MWPLANIAVFAILIIMLIYIISKNNTVNEKFAPYASILSNDVYRTDPSHDNKKQLDHVIY